MKLKTGLTFSVLLSLFLIFATLNEAEARRFGGGGNFGGRSTYSSPYQRSAQPPTRSANPGQQQQAGKQAPGAANPGMMRPGLTGFLGGLMMGGLLGSLFGMGGFHGANLFDFLVIGGLIYLMYRFFAARTAQRTATAYGRAGYDASQGQTRSTYDYANSGQAAGSGFDTDLLFKNKHTGENQVNKDADFSPAPGNIPPSFDEQGFLNGAKIAYSALQKAWDTRDLADIRGLTTDKVFAEIQDQLKASSEENHTDVLKLNAELLDVRELGNEIEAVVLFDAIMREDREGQAAQVREVWHFVKPNNPAQTKWLLDGIQQLAE